MERRGGGSPSEFYTGRDFRTIPEYVRDIAKFDSFMQNAVIDSGLDPNSRAITEALIHGCFDSFKGQFYKIAVLSQMEPGFPQTTPREKVGLALFYAAGVIIDDTIDSPDFPKFSTPADFKSFLFNQEFQIGKPPKSYFIEQLTDFASVIFTPEKQKLVSNYIDSAAEAHWEYANRGKPGSYGLQDALDYRMRTTVEGARVSRQLVNLPVVDDKSMLWAQLLDDAIDMLSDARQESVNLWVGLANDTGEIGVILDEMNKKSRIPDLVRGYGIRRKMPLTLKRYKEMSAEETKSKWSQSSRTFNTILSILI